MTRYQAMFERLAARGEGAFIPFTVLLDPDRERSGRVIGAMVEGGADALELGLAFSDPVADGPTIQKAALRALRNKGTVGQAFSLISVIRKAHREIPIGVLTYANLVFKNGPERFYGQAAECGVDSVLVADLPLLEAEEFSEIAKSHGIDPVLIAPPNLPLDRAHDIARLGRGYTYVVTRRGITGADHEISLSHRRLIDKLKEAGAPPAILGFGISLPEHMRKAIDEGAYGAICGSKIVSIIEDHLGRDEAMLSELTAFVSRMKQATRRSC